MFELNAPRAKTIAITRPQADAERMAAQLQAQGYTTFCVPMLRIEPVPEGLQALERLAPQPVQAICVTSKHAVKALAQQRSMHHLPVYAVGESTARAAKEAGFMYITAGNESVESLLPFIIHACSRSGGAILYARGRHISFNLKDALERQGFAVGEIILYDAVLADSFPADYRQALAQENIDEVRFFSRRSAENYLRLAIRENLEAVHMRITAYCMSQQVAQTLRKLPWKSYTISR